MIPLDRATMLMPNLIQGHESRQFAQIHPSIPSVYALHNGPGLCPPGVTITRAEKQLRDRDPTVPGTDANPVSTFYFERHPQCDVRRSGVSQSVWRSCGVINSFVWQFGGFVPSPILDRSLVPSGTAPKGPALPLKATCEWSERSPGLHKWLRSILEHKGEQPLTPGRIVGCRICRKPMSDVAHLHEHTSRLWRTILLDEPMALRDLVLAIQFVVAKDMAADQVFKQDENRAFATFFWNYDSLDGLDETVRFSDDIDKDCIGPFKDRVHAWAMKARSNPLYPCDLAQLHF